MMDIQTEAFLSALSDALRFPAPATTGRSAGSPGSISTLGSTGAFVPLCSRSRSGPASSLASSTPAATSSTYLGEHHPALLRARMCQARAALSVALSSGDLAAAVAVLDRLTETEGVVS
ncbi:hypothetical protein ACFV4I_06390 [Nocardiopsis alba]|uniref:hypothetical protein n=1 Tax=Nocardiopsis alba TaxID=53437 RepID=UPI0036554087